MAEKSPAFQLYPKDLLSDENVILMDPWAFACYVKLICVCWLEGSIPADREQMAVLGGTPRHHPQIAGLSDEVFENGMNKIERCFERTPKNAHRMTHPRLDFERQKQSEHSEQRREAGKKSGEARRKKARKSKKRREIERPFNPVAVPFEQNANETRTKTNSSSSTPVRRTPYNPPTEDESGTGAGGLPDDAFLKLQESYPKKTRIHAGEATEAYHRVVESAADPLKTLDAVRAGLDRMRAFAESTGTAPKYLPSFADFLNDARFLEPWTEDGAAPFDEKRLTRIPLCEECRLVAQDCPPKIRNYAEKKGLGFCECSPKTSSTLPTSTPLSPNGSGSESRVESGSDSAPSTMSEPRRSP